MKKKIVLILTAIHFLLLTFYVHSFAVNTGASFLRVGVGARPMGMGKAFTAISDDLSSLHYNIGGLAGLKSKEVSFAHADWLVDTKLQFAGYAQPLKSGTIGAGIVYLSHNDLEGRDKDRNETGSFGASDMAVSLGYANTFRGVMTGVNLKLIKQQIDSYSANGIAMDVGGIYKTPLKNFNLGLSVKNIGPDMKFIDESYPLPLTATFGLGYNIGGLNLALDVSRFVYEGKTDLSIGTEYFALGNLSLRMGYAGNLLKSTIDNDLSAGKTDINGIGAGVGLKLFQSCQMDYSFLPYGGLGNIQRISFSSKF